MVRSRVVPFLCSSNTSTSNPARSRSSTLPTCPKTAFPHPHSEPSRWIPLRREMVNNQTGHKTLYQLEHITRDRNNEEFFTARNLEHM